MNNYGLITECDLEEIAGMETTLPYRYRPRHYQSELINTFFDMLEGKSSINRYCVCFHRRAGKDVTFWQCIVAAAMTEVGDYYYLLPQQNQSERVIWNGIVADSDGIPCRFMDFIPPSCLVHAHKQGHRIELVNGSNIHIGGSDNYESFVGGNAKGIVYSEWSITNPAAQEYFAPMIRQNNGWEMYCFTPRGKNHAYNTLNAARREENKNRWYVSLKDITQTFKDDGSPVIRVADVDADIADGMDEAIARQEYYLDFNAAVKGVVYGKELELVRNEGRIRKFELNPDVDVMTFWDLGISKGNATTCWLMQPNGSEINLIGYFEAEDVPLTYFLSNPLVQDKGIVNEFIERHGLKLGTLYFPHDGKNREIVAGQKRHEEVISWGYDVRVLPVTNSVETGILQTKKLFNRLNFHEDYCWIGLNHLEVYRYKIDKTTGRPTSPLHDASSNCADALRQLGQFYVPEDVREAIEAPMVRLVRNTPDYSISAINNNYDIGKIGW